MSTLVPTRRTGRALGVLLLLVLGLALGGLTACEETGAPAAGQPVDDSLPAIVAMTESYHVQADVAVERDDLEGAAEAIETLTGELEPYVDDSPEVRALALDAYTRLARIRLDQGRPEDALSIADQGLEVGGDTTDQSIFGGYLHQTRGNIQIALGDDLGGVESHRAAIVVFKKLLDANEAARGEPPTPDTPSAP